MTLNATAAAISMLTAATVHAQSMPLQWRVEDGGNGHWYWLASEHRMFWTSARSWSQSIGGHLATFGSTTEWNQVCTRFETNEGYWLGFYQDPPVGLPPAAGWRWVTDEPVTFTAWAGGEPNDWSGYQQWVVAGRACAWDDTIPEGGNGIPIVEWSADCNSDGIVDYGQILSGQFADVNTNGVPDICETPTCRSADLTANGIVDGADLGALLAFWGPRNPVFPQADIDANGEVNGADLGILLSFWGACAP